MTHTDQGGLGMLVLTRKMGQSVDIDCGTVTVTVLQVNGSQVKLGLVAPADMAVHRAEVAVKIRDAGSAPVPIARPGKYPWRRTRQSPSANERLTQEAQRMHREDEAAASAEERREREEAARGGDA